MLLARRADLPCASPYILNICLWPFIFISSGGTSCIRLIQLPDMMFTLDKNVLLSTKREEKKEEQEQKTWKSLSSSDNPPGKTEEMVLTCDPSTQIHICKGNKTATLVPGFKKPGLTLQYKALANANARLIFCFATHTVCLSTVQSKGHLLTVNKSVLMSCTQFQA